MTSTNNCINSYNPNIQYHQPDGPFSENSIIPEVPENLFIDQSGHLVSISKIEMLIKANVQNGGDNKHFECPFGEVGSLDGFPGPFGVALQTPVL